MSLEPFMLSRTLFECKYEFSNLEMSKRNAREKHSNNLTSMVLTNGDKDMT